MRDGGRGIQSIEVSGRILRALVHSGEPMMLKDIAGEADLKPAQCHAYLTSMKAVGLVHQDWATGLYSAGPFALRLGVSWLHGNPQTAQAIRDLKALTEEFGVMSLLSSWGEFGPTIVHIYAGLTQAALNLRQGSLFSVTGTANGRVFAAYRDEPDVQAQIEGELAHKSGLQAIGADLTLEDFTAHVSEVRDLGYSVARESPIPGVNAIAVPLFGADGKLAFAASLIGSVENLPVDPDAPAVVRMLQMSRALSGQTIASPQETAAAT